MRVPYNYLPMQFADSRPIIRDWEELIASTEFTLGPVMEAFEQKFAQFVGMKHCIATNNGTDALTLAFKSIGLRDGDEVITVCNTFYATVGAIVRCGATPVFVDTDTRFQIDATKIERAITSRTKVIVPVHWAGASPEMNAIMAIALANGLLVVEDACMGIGGSIVGSSPGTFGIAGAYSVHPLKSLNVMGDGGMVVTNDDGMAEWMRKYRNHGMVDRDHIDFWGVNMRMQPLQAVVASHGLDALSGIINKRLGMRNVWIADWRQFLHRLRFRHVRLAMLKLMPFIWLFLSSVTIYWVISRNMVWRRRFIIRFHFTYRMQLDLWAIDRVIFQFPSFRLHV